MGFDLSGYNLFNAGGYNPYGMNLTGSLYMMNFYDQLKNYYAGGASRADGNAAGGSGASAATTDFQTAFQEAFRKAWQETVGITDSAAAAQPASGSGKTASRAVSGGTASAQGAYHAMNGYGSHPSRIWTSGLSHS